MELANVALVSLKVRLSESLNLTPMNLALTVCITAARSLSDISLQVPMDLATNTRIGTNILVPPTSLQPATVTILRDDRTKARSLCFRLGELVLPLSMSGCFDTIYQVPASGSACRNKVVRRHNESARFAHSFDTIYRVPASGSLRPISTTTQDDRTKAPDACFRLA